MNVRPWMRIRRRLARSHLPVPEGSPTLVFRFTQATFNTWRKVPLGLRLQLRTLWQRLPLHLRLWLQALLTYTAEIVEPWREREKDLTKERQTAIEVLAHRRYHRALDVGCSLGAFTAKLAPLCEELLAVDVDKWAVAAAKEKLASFPHVRVERCTLPEETPEGPFDLIVAAEVLYYWPKDTLLAALRYFEEVLAPDGTLLVAHGRVPSRRRKIVEKIRPLFLRRWVLKIKSRAPLADEIHKLLFEHTRLTNTTRLVEPRYRLDFFENK